jgi:hypothetical protein
MSLLKQGDDELRAHIDAMAVTLRTTVDAGVEGVARETRRRAEEIETNLRTCDTSLRQRMDELVTSQVPPAFWFGSAFWFGIPGSDSGVISANTSTTTNFPTR